MLKRSLIFLIPVAVAACAAPINVSTTFDHSASFRQYRSFAMMPAPSQSGTQATGTQGTGTPGTGTLTADPAAVQEATRADNSLVRREVKTAIAADLVDKGMAQVDPASADIGVSYYISSEKHTEVTTTPGYDYGYGWDPGYGWGFPYYGGAWDYGYMPPTIDVKQVRQGTLVVDIVDMKTKKLLWRSVGQQDIPKSITAEQMHKMVAKMVEKTLADFPPKKAS